MTHFIAEFLGTLILILLGDGVVANVVLKKSKGENAGWMVITTGWAFAVAVPVYIFAATSGAHFNPAVTVGLAVAGLFPWGEVPIYLSAQFLGAFVGAVLVIIQYGAQFKNAKNTSDGNVVGIFATGPAIDNGLYNFLSETIATFVFIFTLLNLGDFTKGLKPLIVGLLIMVVGQALGGTTGFALNPARDWAPRFAYTVLPVPNKSNANWGYAWVPMLGPIVGGILAAGLQYLLV